MRVKSVCVLAISATCLLSIAAGSKQIPEVQPEAKIASTSSKIPVVRKALSPMPRTAIADAPLPFFRVSVAWFLELDPEQHWLYETMSATLRNVNDLPASRTNFFSGFITDYRMNNWSGMVYDVVSNPDGTFFVSAQVSPVLTDQDGMQVSTRVLCRYNEIYLVDQNGMATYLGSEDPFGEAGTNLSSILN